MSNCEIFSLRTIELEQHHVREILRCLLHTVIFNRALGPVRPVDRDSELFDITWVECGDPTVERKVEERITQFCSWVEHNPGKRGQVCLSFYERRQRQAWFGASEERLHWEQWQITLSILGSSTALEEAQAFASASLRAQRRQRTQAALEECLTAIVRHVNEKRDHIPPVVSGSAVTFPFEISIAGETSSVFGLDMVKRMLLHSNPPSVLH